jgi:hypothetical protein
LNSEYAHDFTQEINKSIEKHERTTKAIRNAGFGAKLNANEY